MRSMWIMLIALILVAAAHSRALPSDAGGAWRALKSGTTQPLYGVACFTALRCKVVGAGGTIRYTKNGGNTWQAQMNPFQGSSTILYRITCLAPSTCYVIARPNTILVTHNGGATWSSHVIPASIPSSGIGTNLTDPSCLSRLSYNTRSRMTVCRVGLLDISCVNARTCFAVATPSSIWMTNDYGTTWSKQVIPPTVPCNGDCGKQTFLYPLEWISCLRTGLCRAGGSILIGSHEGFANAVIETSRPGAPWTLVNPGPNRFSPDAAKCPTPTRCYGVYSSNPFNTSTEVGSIVWLTTNAGATWQARPSGSNRIRNSIACPTATMCYTVGNQGTITGTTNGTDFSAQTSPTTRNLYDIKCLSVTTCYAVGNKGAIVSRR
jgi:photosystem II stability/assembly factor-like uncharacterized protein